jgi:uncharacterized protein YjgD (DUF1641 family)
MARPIHSVTTTDRSADAPTGIGNIARETQKDREALSHFLDLIRVLDERGVLRLLSDLATTNDEVIGAGVAWLSRPGASRAVRNLRVLLETLERVDPNQLDRLIREVGRAFDRGSKVPRSDRRLGALALLRQLGEPETNRGLRVLLALLKDLGSDRP